MNWLNPQERAAFTQQTLALASRAVGQRHALEAAKIDALHTESPIETIFAVWFDAARAHLLAEGFSRFALALQPQRWVTTDEERRYRLDFAIEPMDEWLARSLTQADMPLKLGVELDGHDYHERTLDQVTERNQRDRDLSALRWRILHFSGSELHRNPMIVVVEVLVAGADALDQAKAALFHG